MHGEVVGRRVANRVGNCLPALAKHGEGKKRGGEDVRSSGNYCPLFDTNHGKTKRDQQTNHHLFYRTHTGPTRTHLLDAQVKFLELRAELVAAVEVDEGVLKVGGRIQRLRLDQQPAVVVFRPLRAKGAAAGREGIPTSALPPATKKKKKGKERKKGGYGGLSSKGCVRTGCKQAGHFFPFPRQRSITADATTGGTSPTCRWEHRRPPRRPPHPTKNRTSLHWIARHSPPRVKNAERQKETGQPNEKEEQANGRVKREATSRPRASRGDKEIGTGRITGARVVWGSDGGVGAHHGRDRPNEAGEK